jgi:hypothetical protein
MPVRALLLIVPTFLLITGCSSDPNAQTHIEKVVPVSGTLTYQGKPLEFYQVTFMPTEGQRVATGVTDAAGKFTMGTNDKGDGAPPGTHKVAFVWVGPPSNVEAGQEQIIDDPSRLPKPSVKIPEKYSDPEKSGIRQEVPPSGLDDLKFDLR